VASDRSFVVLSLSSCNSRLAAPEPRQLALCKILHAEKRVASKLRSLAGVLRGVDGAAR
jgi:hypothetical protein